MTQQERKQVYNIINDVLPFLTDEELKTIAALILTRETCDGTPIININKGAIKNGVLHN